MKIEDSSVHSIHIRNFDRIKHRVDRAYDSPYIGLEFENSSLTLFFGRNYSGSDYLESTLAFADRLETIAEELRVQVRKVQDEEGA